MSVPNYFLEANYKEAYKFYKRKCYDDALRQLADIPEGHNYYNIYYLLGCIYIRKQKFEEAKKNLLQCEKLNPKNHKAFLRLISLNIQLNNISEAERFCKIAESLIKKTDKKDEYEFLQFKASFLNASKRYIEASQAYDKLLAYAKTPDEKIKFKLSKIKALNNAGYYKEAEALYSAIQNDNVSNENNKKIQYYGIMLMVSLGQFMQAKEKVQLLQCTNLFTRYEMMYLKVYVYYTLNLFKDILETACDIVECVDKYVDISQIKEKLEKIEEDNIRIQNENFVNRIKKIDENYGLLILFYVGVAYRNLNQFDKFNKCMKLYKENYSNWENEQYYFEMAQYYFQINDTDQCTINLTNSLSKNAFFMPAIKFKIFFYNNIGLVEEAKKIFNTYEAQLKEYEKRVAPDLPTEEITYNTISLSFDVDPEKSGQSIQITGRANENPIVLNKINPAIKTITNPSPNTSSVSMSGIVVTKQPVILNQGGFGIVTKEWLSGDDAPPIACKTMLNLDESSKKELRNEVYSMLSFEHKNIIRLLGFFELTGKIMMELAEGGDIDKLIKNNQNLPLDFKLHLCIGIAEGLAYVHSKGFIHGDMKPQNVLLDKPYDPNILNDYPCPKICDFGLSFNLRKDFKLGGTPNYLAPEVCRGFNPKNDAASDCYSFGMTMFHIFSGEKPYSKETNQNEILDKIRKGEFPDFEKILKNEICPMEVKNLIKACCNKDENRRPKMFEIAQELNHIYLEIRENNDNFDY